MALKYHVFKEVQYRYFKIHKCLLLLNIFQVNLQVQYARGVEATFLGKYKQFSQSNKPITQLYAINEFDIILSLSGGLVSIHRLDNYEKIATVSKTKGASYFSAGIDVSFFVAFNKLDAKFCFLF